MTVIMSAIIVAVGGTFNTHDRTRRWRCRYSGNGFDRGENKHAIAAIEGGVFVANNARGSGTSPGGSCRKDIVIRADHHVVIDRPATKR